MSHRDAKVVQAGYDAIADRYLAWASRIEGDPRETKVATFADALPANARILDLGCGAGAPSTQELARRFEVVGVDISESQLRLARGHVPRATLIRADIAEVEFPDQTFDGVASLYAIIHVPRVKHRSLFGRIARWLKPGGLLLAALGAVDDPGWTGDWLGTQMFFSSFDAETNRELLRDFRTLQRVAAMQANGVAAHELGVKGHGVAAVAGVVHGTSWRKAKTRLAGRSARRRRYQGYQNEP